MLSRLFSLLAPLSLCTAVALASGQEASIVDAQVGFGGRYKLGAWTPVVVELRGVAELTAPRVEVIAPDGEGAPAVVSVPLEKPAADRLQTLTRVGRRGATLRIRLLDGERLVDQWRSGQDLDNPTVGLAAGEPMLVRAGRDAPVASLPIDWRGYEGVDALIVSGLSEEQLAGFTEPRVAALEQWINSGGRLVLGGGPEAEGTIGPNGPLRRLAPGEFVELARLANTGVLEDFAGSEEAIDAPFGGIPVGRLTQPRGVVQLFAGGRASEMPLLVRSVTGFGSVTYAAFNLDDPAFANWPDAGRLRSLIVSGESDASTATDDAALIASAYEDLAGAIRVRLGEAFAGVQTASILTLVAAVSAYLLLLGPGAYYLGKNVVGKTTVAWLVFPALMIGVAAAAAGWGAAATGEKLVLNKLEIVDFDSQTGLERGVLWAQLFSPDARRLDLACQPAAAGAQGHLCWFGLPGGGLGGMQTPADSLLAGSTRYTTSPTLDGLRGAPINRRASRAFTARWTANGRPGLGFELAPTGSGLVEGALINNTKHTLTDIRLIASNWAWRLADLAPGEVATIDAGADPARLRTLVQNDLAGGSGRVRLSADRLDAAGLAYLLMFYRALDGDALSPLPDYGQGDCDLSHAIDAGRPVVVARVDGEQAPLTANGEPLPADDLTTFFRFIGPPLGAGEQEALP